MLRSSSLPSTRKKTSYNRSRNELGSSKRLAADRSPSVRLHQVHELGPVSKSRRKTNDTAAAVAATAFLRSREDVEDEEEYAEFGKNFGEDDDNCMWLTSGTLSPSSCFSDRRFSVILDPSLDEWLVSFGHTVGDHHKIKSLESRRSFDLERNGLWVSSVDLQGGDDSSKWIEESEYTFGSEIVEFSGSQLFSSSEYVPEDLDLLDTEADEPLFWPSDKKSDWSPQSKWDLFIMSPRKVARKNETSTPTELIHLRNYDSKEGYSRRKIVLSSGSKSSKVLKMKPRANSGKEMKRMKTMPSRLGNPPENSVKIVPLDDHATELASEKILQPQKTMVRYENSMEYGFPLKDELPIETLMGLEEFDGHEGIDSGFNKDYFSFDESL